MPKQVAGSVQDVGLDLVVLIVRQKARKFLTTTSSNAGLTPNGFEYIKNKLKIKIVRERSVAVGPCRRPYPTPSNAKRHASCLLGGWQHADRSAARRIDARCLSLMWVMWVMWPCVCKSKTRAPGMCLKKRHFFDLWVMFWSRFMRVFRGCLCNPHGIRLKHVGQTDDPHGVAGSRCYVHGAGDPMLYIAI